RLKDNLDDMERRHTEQLKKVIATHLQEEKDAADSRTLQVTVELLTEQIRKLKVELQESKHQSSLYLEAKENSHQLQAQLDQLTKEKRELANNLKNTQLHAKNLENLVESTKGQLEDQKQVLIMREKSWKQELALVAEAQRTKLLELELEKSRMLHEL